MQRHALHVLLIYLVITALSACKPTAYFPQRINNPGFRQAGEAKLTTALQLQENDTYGKTVAPLADAAYSVTDHIGILASYRSIVNKRLLEHNATYTDPDTSYGGRFNAKYVEAGAGYFSNFSYLGQVEVYAGGGIGKQNRIDIVTPQFDYSTRYYKLFIQPGFNVTPGKRSGKLFKVGTGFRITMIDYYAFVSANPATRYVLTKSINADGRDLSAAPFVYFEPYINVEGGLPYLKLNAQISGNVGLSPLANQINTTPCFSFGLTFQYAARFYK